MVEVLPNLKLESQFFNKNLNPCKILPNEVEILLGQSDETHFMLKALKLFC